MPENKSTAYQVSIEGSEEILDSDLSINTANDSVLPCEDSPNKEHHQETEMQELEKSFSRKAIRCSRFQETN